jgi:PTS system nitrogen regulatory IIA component
LKISDLLKQDMIILELEHQDMENVLKEMVHFLKKKNKISKDKELFEKLLQRERLGSTAIGDGVAIPHCKIKLAKNPLVMLAVSRKGADFNSPDGTPSHIFFLVVSSPDNPSLNLQILAAIAHLVRKADTMIQKILKAEKIYAVLEIIREEEEKLE